MSGSGGKRRSRREVERRQLGRRGSDAATGGGSFQKTQLSWMDEGDATQDANTNEAAVAG